MKQRIDQRALAFWRELAPKTRKRIIGLAAALAAAVVLGNVGYSLWMDHFGGDAVFYRAMADVYEEMADAEDFQMLGYNEGARYFRLRRQPGDTFRRVEVSEQVKRLFVRFGVTGIAKEGKTLAFVRGDSSAYAAGYLLSDSQAPELTRTLTPRRISRLPASEFPKLFIFYFEGELTQ